MAELFKAAFFAFGFSGDTDLAAVMDELVRKCDPAILGDALHQVLLDLGRSIALSET